MKEFLLLKAMPKNEISSVRKTPVQISFEIVSPPVSLNSAYITRRGSFQRILSPEGRQFTETCAFEAMAALGQEEMFSEPILLKTQFFFADSRRRDLDNYNKLLLDSLKGVLYDDDSRIFTHLSTKRYNSSSPRIIIDAITFDPDYWTFELELFLRRNPEE